MTNEQPKEIQVQDTTSIRQSFSELGAIKKQFTPDQVKFIVDTVAPGLNDQEVWLFLLKASLLKLNPLMGEIFGYVSKDEYGNRKLVTIAGRNGKRNRALQSGLVEYVNTEAIYIKEVDVPADKENGLPARKMKIQVEPWDGTLWGAKCTLKRKDMEQPIIVTVPLAEYDTQRSVWKYKKETMIKKVAESQAIDASGVLGAADLYDESERFDEPRQVSATVPEVENADAPADEAKLKTIEVLGGDTDRQYTNQEAAEEIQRLNALKGKGKQK